MPAELIFETIGENSIIILNNDNKKYALSSLQPRDSLMKEFYKIKGSPKIIEVLIRLLNNEFNFIRLGYSGVEGSIVNIFNRCKYNIQKGVPQFVFSLNSGKDDTIHLVYSISVLEFCNNKYDFIDRNIPIIDYANYTGRETTIKKIQLNFKYKKFLLNGYDILDIDKNAEFYDDSFKFKTLHKRDKSKEFILLVGTEYSRSTLQITIEQWVGNEFDIPILINHKLIDNVIVKDKNYCGPVYITINDIVIKYRGIAGIILRRDTLYLKPYVYDGRYGRDDDTPVSEINIKNKLIVANKNENGIIELIIKNNV